MKLPYHNNLRIEQFERTLDIQNIHNSYKILWLKSIINKVEIGVTIISFSEIVLDMLVDSFELVSISHLKYGGTDVIPIIIKSYHCKTIDDFKHALADDNIKSITNRITEFVPYRLLSSFYKEELKNMPDSQKNSAISQLSNQDILSFYSIDKKEKRIIVNSFWANYIIDNISIIKHWIDYKLIVFLQRRNPSVPNIPFKVSPIRTRNLAKAKGLWSKAIHINPALSIDLYLGQPFSETSYKQHGSLSIDHFLPWSFVSHDLLWNLIPTHKNINSAKSNQLPNERFIDSFIQQQYSFASTIQAFCKHDLDDYLSISDLWNTQTFSFDYHTFYSVMHDNTMSLYKIAKNQGYSTWSASF